MFINHSHYWTAADRKGKVSKAVYVSFFISVVYTRNLANINMLLRVLPAGGIFFWSGCFISFSSSKHFYDFWLIRVLLK